MKKSKRKTVAAPKLAPETRVGAASALERLEAEEAGLFAAYEKSKLGQDPLETKVARDAWLKTSESLRKFDLLIEAARRETGELVARADAERFLQNIGQLLHWALYRVAGMESAWDVVDRAFAGYIARFDPKRSAPVEECPGWMHKALFRHGDWRRGPEFEAQHQSIGIIGTGINLHRDNEHAFFEYLKSQLPAPTPAK
jgi:hypothetical protein